jgi:hypothetical protein
MCGGCGSSACERAKLASRRASSACGRQRLGIAIEAEQRGRRRAQGQPGSGTDGVAKRGGWLSRHNCTLRKPQLPPRACPRPGRRPVRLPGLAATGPVRVRRQPRPSPRRCQMPAAGACTRPLPGTMQLHAEGAGGGLFGRSIWVCDRRYCPQAAGRGGCCVSRCWSKPGCSQLPA